MAHIKVATWWAGQRRAARQPYYYLDSIAVERGLTLNHVLIGGGQR